MDGGMPKHCQFSSTNRIDCAAMMQKCNEEWTNSGHEDGVNSDEIAVVFWQQNEKFRSVPFQEMMVKF